MLFFHIPSAALPRFFQRGLGSPNKRIYESVYASSLLAVQAVQVMNAADLQIS